MHVNLPASVLLQSHADLVGVQRIHSDQFAEQAMAIGCLT